MQEQTITEPITLDEITAVLDHCPECEEPYRIDLQRIRCGDVLLCMLCGSRMQTQPYLPYLDAFRAHNRALVELTSRRSSLRRRLISVLAGPPS